MPEQQQDEVSWRRPSAWSLPVAVTVTVIGALLLAVLLIEVFSLLLYGSGTSWREGTLSLSDSVKLALVVVAGIGAAQGLVVTYRRQRGLEKDEAGKRDQRRLMTERFGAAREQLGSAPAGAVGRRVRDVGAGRRVGGAASAMHRCAVRLSAAPSGR